MSSAASAVRLPAPTHRQPGRWRRIAGALGWSVAVPALAWLVAVLEPLPLALAAGGAVAAVVTLIQPLAAVALLLFAVPFGVPMREDASAGEPALTAVEPLVALLALAWLLRGVRRRGIAVHSSGLVASLGLLGLLMLFSTTYAASFSAAAKETVKWFELLVVLLVVAGAGLDRRSTAWLLAALFVAGALEAAWGIAQVATGGGPSGFEVGGLLRAYGTFAQPNPFGGYLATILPVAVAMALAPGAPRAFRWLAAGAALVLGAGVALSQSRGAWLGLGVAALVLLLTWSRRTRLLLVPAAALAGLALVAALAGFFPAAIVDRLAQTVQYFGVFDVRTVELTDENWSIVERMARWQAAWYMFLDSPWLGVGIGNYAEAYPRYYLDNWVDPLGHAHNYYLNTLAELGVVGFGLLLLSLALVFRHVGGALRSSIALHRPPDPYWRALLAGILGSLVVFSMHSLFDNLLVHGVNVQVGFLIGLGLVAADRLRPLASGPGGGGVR